MKLHKIQPIEAGYGWVIRFYTSEERFVQVSVGFYPDPSIVETVLGTMLVQEDWDEEDKVKLRNLLAELREKAKERKLW